jgi:O-antigen/teichoic acid export membrane protein
MDSRYKRLGKNTALVFMGSAGSKIITLLMLPYYTRILSTADYGLSDLIATYASIMTSVVSCCIADAIFVFPKNADRENQKKYFSSGFVFSIASYALWAIITLIVSCVGGGGTITSYAWWIYAMTISYAIQGYLQQFNLGTDKMVVYSTTGIVQVGGMAILAFVLMPEYGLQGYLLSIMIANIIAAIFSLAASKSYNFFSLGLIDKFHLTELLKYGIPLIPNTIMWWIVNGINRPIMEANLGLDAIGIYAVANKLPAVITMLFGVFSSAWGVTLLEEFGKSDFNRFFNKTMKVIFFGIAIFTVLFILGSKLIVRVFAAPEFFDAWRYVPVLSEGVLLSCMSGLIGGIFSAEKKSKYFFYSSIWGAGSSLVLTLLGVKMMGLMGVCLAVAFSFLVMVVVRLSYAWKHINLFSVRYYTIMILLVTVVSAVVILSESLVYTLLTGLVAVSIMILMNRQELSGLLQLVKSRIKR